MVYRGVEADIAGELAYVVSTAIIGRLIERYIIPHLMVSPRALCDGLAYYFSGEISLSREGKCGGRREFLTQHPKTVQISSRIAPLPR